MGKYCFGIDVGGTTVKCGLFETDGTLLDKWEIVTRTENGGENVLPDIAATIISKLTVKGIAKEDVVGVGVGIPGPVMQGVVPVAVNLHWGEKNVEYELGKILDMKVRAGNDANVAALGELWKGGGEGKENLIMVTLGTGVGGGIIVDGKIIEGSHGAGGEIGHAHVDDNIKDPCNCGNYGCLEQVASATGVVRLAKEELQKNPDAVTTLRDQEVTSKAVFDAYKDGDAVASAIVNRFASYLGTALATFACVTDPEVIVIGGGVSKAGEVLTDIVGKYYRTRAFSSCNKDLNRLKVILAEKKKSNLWLSKQLGCAPTTVSKWCTNSSQPPLESLMKITRLLNVEFNDLVRYEELDKDEEKGSSLAEAETDCKHPKC